MFILSGWRWAVGYREVEYARAMMKTRRVKYDTVAVIRSASDNLSVVDNFTTIY